LTSSISQEFQLIELAASCELSAYQSLISSNSVSTVRLGGIGSVLKSQQSENFFVLSMGHRIQFFNYDRVLDQVKVFSLELLF
jgi:hypothetical protein